MKENSKIYSDLTDIRDTLLMIDGVKLYKINKEHFEAFFKCLNDFEKLTITNYRIANVIYDEAAKLASKIREYFIEHLYSDVMDDPVKAMNIQNDFAKFIIPQMNRFIDFFCNEVCLKVA